MPANASFQVLPDGCQDVIIRYQKGQAPSLQLSPLFDQTFKGYCRQDSSFWGYRLQPGLIIDPAKYQKYCHDMQHSADQHDQNRISDIIQACCQTDRDLSQALECLALPFETLKQAQSHSGLTARTLQRLIYKRTNRPPKYWYHLARLRRAARLLGTTDQSIAEIALTGGYSDQAHFTRHCRQCFGVTPGQFRQRPDLQMQLDSPAYG